MLDPLNITPDQINDTYPIGDFPSLTKEQMSFGYLPDRRNLFPGDLILFQPVVPSLVDEVSQLAQKTQYIEGRSGWTHAAIYARYWRIFDATPKKNVSVGDLMPYIPRYKILVRRPCIFRSLSESDAMLKGYSIAMEAALHVSSSKYGKMSALKAGIRSALRLQKPRIKISEIQKNSVICSGLYAKCFEIATESQLFTSEMKHNGESITPLLLSKLSTMYDVDVGWIKLDLDK